MRTFSIALIQVPKQNRYVAPKPNSKNLQYNTRASHILGKVKDR